MEEEAALYKKVAEVIADDPEVDPFKLLKDTEEKERYLKEVEEKITSLYLDAHDKKLDPDLEPYVTDMIANMTDGRLKDLIIKEYNNPEVVRSEMTAAEKQAFIKSMRALKEEFKALRLSAKIDREKLGISGDIDCQKRSIDSMELRLEQLKESLNKLKSNLNDLMYDPCLNDDVRRDLVFENNMRNLCEKLNNLNQYTEAAKTIERICRDASKLSDDANTSSDYIPEVISTLLKDVESALLIEDDVIVEH